MAKVYGVVKRALGLLQVIDPKMPVSASDMETGIEALNDMMSEWESLPLPLGWSNVSSPEDEMPTPPAARKAIAANLAMNMASDYGVEPMATVVAQASSGLAILRRQYAAANPLDRNVVMPLRSRYGRYGVRYGGWWPYL